VIFSSAKSTITENTQVFCRFPFKAFALSISRNSGFPAPPFMYWNYVSCCLTVVSTLLVGKRLWHGWILAGLNSVIICLIGFQTKQWGFIPANLFCLVIYAHNIRKWRVVEQVEVKPAALTIAGKEAISQSTHISERERPVRVRNRRFRQRARYSAYHKIKIRVMDGIDVKAREDLKGYSTPSRSVAERVLTLLARP
jgi:hypothetical protein